MPKLKLYIIGAGGFGREVLSWCRAIDDVEWDVAGFLDDNTEALAGVDVDVQVVGSPNTWAPADDERFICALGNPATKLKVASSMEARGAKFITLVHPSAVVGDRCSLGAGSILCPQTVLTCDVTLGDHVTVNVAASVGHDATIGRGCTLSGHADVTGFATLDEGVFLGSHAVVMPSAKVGAFATVGAGSVVLRKVAPKTSVMGVPARKIASHA